MHKWCVNEWVCCHKIASKQTNNFFLSLSKCRKRERWEKPCIVYYSLLVERNFIAFRSECPFHFIWIFSGGACVVWAFSHFTNNFNSTMVNVICMWIFSNIGMRKNSHKYGFNLMENDHKFNYLLLSLSLSLNRKKSNIKAMRPSMLPSMRIMNAHFMRLLTNLRMNCD